MYRRPDFGATTLDLRAVGDISLGRNVTPFVRAHPAVWLFAPTADLLHGDLTVGNLEGPLTKRQRPEQLRKGPFRLPADPALADRLAPFHALSLANNHALDAQPEGLAEAQTTLATHNILPLGVAGCGSLAPAPAPTQATLLAFNAVHDPADQPDEAAHCGRAWLDDQALQAVTAARQAGKPVVVLVHWGVEYAQQPSAEQRDWAQKLVAAGADLIIGSHPHVVQPAEWVEAGGRRGFVAYSLGNFVFDQPDRPETSHSVVLRARWDAQGLGEVAAGLVALINNQPVPLATTDPAASAVLAALAPVTATLVAWRWDGSTLVPVAVPTGTTLPVEPTELQVDIRGNGVPAQVMRQDGLVQVFQDDKEVWRNESSVWQVAGMTAGDADNDGRFEVLLRLWKPDANGNLRSHPFMMGWRGGYYRIFWGGSAVAQPIQDAVIGSLDGRRNGLVVLEGGAKPGDAADHITLMTWQGWNFQRQWQSPAGRYRHVALIDLNDDGANEIVAEVMP